eukprot:CAMPEP_0184297936 /NCGR_PEP_ID=MMETSP1049-20130417/8810_1 /TAXON_ID=77928 /ORGANISM="Proteomonas sulcata, Strain CCMP704" /LENGTH=73 /DNA_ID=CAMNT_0026607891 /DNA_START=119 /DNA_END=337 /DNA_ORIENTATION=-
MELIHMDYAGPFKTPSIGGAKYFVTFTDDYSRYVWTYLTPRKDTFQHILTQFQQDTANLGKRTTLRSDNGGEF